MKLKLEDIKIKTPSEQLSALIHTRYEAIEALAVAIERSASTTRKYLKEPNAAPEGFKQQISQMFDKEYDEMLISADEQISRWVDEVTENISQYKYSDDIDTLKVLRNLCIEKNNKIEIGKMYRNLGMCYYYNNNSVAAVELLLFSINTLSSENIFDLVLRFKSDLCLVYYYNHNYKNAENLFESIEFLISELKCADTKTVFLHNYRWGILYNNTTRTKLARSKFEKALTFAQNKFEIGHATMGIGLSYKKERQFSTALEYYQDALEMYDPDDYISRSVIYNNMAEIYKESRKYKKAMEHINIALKLLDDRDPAKLFLCNVTYIEIKILQGESNNALAALFDMLMVTKNLFLFRKYAIEAISIILKYAVERNNIKIIRSLSTAVISMIDNAVFMKYDTEFIQALKAGLGDIHMGLISYEINNISQRR